MSTETSRVNPAWVEAPYEFRIFSASRDMVAEAIKRREELNAVFRETHPDYKGAIEPYAITIDPESGMFTNIVCYAKPPCGK